MNEDNSQIPNVRLLQDCHVPLYLLNYIWQREQWRRIEWYREKLGPVFGTDADFPADFVFPEPLDLRSKAPLFCLGTTGPITDVDDSEWPEEFGGEFEPNAEFDAFYAAYDTEEALKFRLKVLFGVAKLAARVAKWKMLIPFVDLKSLTEEAADSTSQPTTRLNPRVIQAGRSVAAAIEDGDVEFFAALADWAQGGFGIAPKEFDDHEIPPLSRTGGSLKTKILSSFLEIGCKENRLPTWIEVRDATREKVGGSKFNDSNFREEAKELGLGSLPR